MSNIISYYGNEVNNFYNTVYALNIAWENYISNIVLDGDLTRIIYASTGFALRKRAETSENNKLELPFLNYKVGNNGLSLNTERNWFSHIGHVDGVYIPALEKKIRVVPVNVSYDCTLWVYQDIDLLYTYYNAYWEESNETTISFNLNINGNDVPVIAVLNLKLNYATEFNEQDWLEKNNIRSINLDFSFDTWFIKDPDVEVSMTREAILEFKNKKVDTADYETFTIEKYFSEIS